MFIFKQMTDGASSFVCFQSSCLPKIGSSALGMKPSSCFSVVFLSSLWKETLFIILWFSQEEDVFLIGALEAICPLAQSVACLYFEMGNYILQVKGRRDGVCVWGSRAHQKQSGAQASELLPWIPTAENGSITFYPNCAVSHLPALWKVEGYQVFEMTLDTWRFSCKHCLKKNCGLICVLHLSPLFSSALSFLLSTGCQHQ